MPFLTSHRLGWSANQTFAPKSGKIKLGSGHRADLIIDMVGSPGAHFDFADTYYSRSTYKFLTLAYED